MLVLSVSIYYHIVLKLTIYSTHVETVNGKDKVGKKIIKQIHYWGHLEFVILISIHFHKGKFFLQKLIAAWIHMSFEKIFEQMIQMNDGCQ